MCGTVNSPNNRHCQGCAFLLDRIPGPESSTSLRGIVVVGSVLLGLALVIVLIVNRSIGDDPDSVGADSATTASTTLEDSDTTGPREESSPLMVSSVSASSSYGEALGPDNVIDNDPSSYWNDASLHGENAELIFEFSPPVAIDSIVIQNPVDGTAFTRNYRIRGYEIVADDLPSSVAGELADTREPQTITLTTTSTSRLVLRVTSTYSAGAVGDQPAFEELAVAEVAFLGRPSP